MQSESPTSAQADRRSCRAGPRAGPSRSFTRPGSLPLGLPSPMLLSAAQPGAHGAGAGGRAVWLGGSAGATHCLAAAGRAVAAAGRMVRWMEPHPAPAPALAALSDGLLRTVEGTVVDAGPVRGETEQNLDEPASPKPRPEPSQRIDLRVSSLEVVTDTGDAQTPVEGRVRLTVRWPEAPASQQPFHCGERLRAAVRLLPPEVYHDPRRLEPRGFPRRTGHHLHGHGRH
jgi:hypothetical protein